jgi:hypothetical protein
VIDPKEGRACSSASYPHDAGWYHVGEPGGGRASAVHPQLDAVRPRRCAKRVLTEPDVRTLLVANPARLLSGG